MSNRERWIIYPLLFLSLGVSLRDKLYGFRKVAATAIQATSIGADSIRVKAIHGDFGMVDVLTCRQLVVLGGANGTTNVVELAENSLTHEGVLRVNDGKGDMHVVVTSSEGGGVIRTSGADKKALVVLDHGPAGGGRIAMYDADNLLYFVNPTIGPIKELPVPNAPPISNQPPPEENQPAPPEEQQPSPPTP